MTAPRAVPVTWRSTVMLAITAFAGLLAFCWPLFVSPGATVSGDATAPMVLALLLVLLIALVVSEISATELDVKAVAMLGVLTAVGAAVRPLGAGTAGIETVFFLLILGGRVFGPGLGFVQGATTLFASALITGGVGPWLPYQMVASGFVGLFAGLLPRTDPTTRGGRGRELALLAGFGALAAFAFGMLMDFAFWPFAITGGTAGFDPAAGPVRNLHTFLVVNAVTGMGWNVGRAVTNVALVITLGPAVLKVLRRAARRARFD